MVDAAAHDPFAVGAEGDAHHMAGVPKKGKLIAVEKAAEIGMLPTTQVGTASGEVLPGTAGLAILPFALGQGDLARIQQMLGPLVLGRRTQREEGSEIVPENRLNMTAANRAVTTGLRRHH